MIKSADLQRVNALLAKRTALLHTRQQLRDLPASAELAARVVGAGYMLAPAEARAEAARALRTGLLGQQRDIEAELRELGIAIDDGGGKNAKGR